jgi:hypothetical protein
MKKFLMIAVVIVVAACQTNQEKQEEYKDEKNIAVTKTYSLLGDWQFLNKQGSYTESFFSEKYFKVFNRQMGMSPNFKYSLNGDTLSTSFTRGTKVSTSKSLIIWLDENKVIMKSRTGSDTMDRILTNDFLLGNTDLRVDSSAFSSAYRERNKKYLLDRGIITKEEVEAFEKENVIPEDVKNKLENK